MAIENTDAKLRFLRGLEENLPAIKTDGYVYVTTDTRAMYVDYASGGTTQRIRIGDVLTVANMAALPAIAKAQDGVLYYCIGENILCTPKGEGEDRIWQQINKQQTLAGIITELSVTAAAEAGKGIKVSTTITGAGGSRSGAFNIVDGANTAISVASNQVKVGAKDTTITGALSAEAATGGGATVTLTNTTGGTDASGKALTGSTNGGSFTIVGSGATVDVADNKITIGAKPKSVTNTFAADGKFTTTVTDAAGGTTTSTAVTPTITYGNGATSSVAFKSGTATLDIYTKAQTDTLIDNKLKTANAMTFKGTLGSTADNGTVATLPTSASLGDTYVVVTSKSYSYKKQGADANTSQACKIGDMFIAGPGDEDASGNLSPLCWTYVPAGDDDLPVVTAAATATDITFTSTLAGQGTTIGKVAVGSGLTGANSGTTLTVSHATVDTSTPTADTAVTQSKGTNAEYTAISDITVSNGHVTAIKTKKLTVVDTTLSDVTYAATADTNGATLTVTAADTKGTTKSGTVTIKTSGESAAQVSVDGGAVVIDTIWGSFN